MGFSVKCSIKNAYTITKKILNISCVTSDFILLDCITTNDEYHTRGGGALT